MPKRKQDQDGVYERPDSPFFWATYTDGRGRRIRCSTRVRTSGGFSARREAEALLSKWKSEAFQEQMWGRTPDQEKPAYTFDDVMLAYLNDRVPMQRSGEKRVKATLKNLYGVFNGFPMDELTDTHIRAYIRHRQGEGAAPGTINKEIGALSAAINYVNKHLGWECRNPAAGKKLPEPDGIVRWITKDEAFALIQTASDEPRAVHLVDFIQLSLNTGCRLGEILGLEWRRVDLSASLFILEAEHNKSKRRRSVPLNEEAREALINRARYRATYCPDSPWVFCRKSGKRIKSVRRAFKTACRKAGIENFRIHDERHTLASWLVMEGVPLIEVRDVLGHSTIKMTERYAHLHPENLRAAVGKIRGVSRSGHAGSTSGPQEDEEDAATG